MTPKEYQEASREFAFYPGAGDRTDEGRRKSLDYLMLGLIGETGELSEKAKKCLRDQEGDWCAASHAMLPECGDVLWYLAQTASELGLVWSQLPVASHTSQLTLVQMIRALAREVTRLDYACAAAQEEFEQEMLEHIEACINLTVLRLNDICTGPLNTPLFGDSTCDVASRNTQKLTSRKARGRLGGNGDNR